MKIQRNIGRTSRPPHPALLVGTRKGAFILHANARRRGWKISDPILLGNIIHHVVQDPRDYRIVLFAAKAGHLGPTIYVSHDGGQSVTESKVPPAWPKNSEKLSVAHNFYLTPGHPSEPGTWYLGTSPAGLFKSSDQGLTWQSVDSFNSHPDRAKWVGGPQDAPPGGSTLHSIHVHPENPRHIYFAVSCAGVFESTDGGKNWGHLNSGLEADFSPDSTQPLGHDPHCLRLHPKNPNLLYQQNHFGVYRLERPGKKWRRVGKAMPEEIGDIGFPLVVSPHDPRKFWIFPMDGTSVWPRTAIGGKPACYQSRDGGDSFIRQDQGLPRGNCFITVKRQAMTTDKFPETGVYFGSTSGEIWGSANGGELFRSLVRHLPEIYSLESALL